MINLISGPHPITEKPEDFDFAGYCDGGRYEVYHHNYGHGVLIIDRIDRKALPFEDSDGPVYYLEDEEDDDGTPTGQAWVCEGTARRWRLDCGLTNAEKIGLEEKAKRLDDAARLLRMAANADAGSDRPPAYYIDLADALIEAGNR